MNQKRNKKYNQQHENCNTVKKKRPGYPKEVKIDSLVKLDEIKITTINKHYF